MSARRLRVLHLGNPGGLYGAERWILALARHLPSADVHSVLAVIEDAPGPRAALLTRGEQLGFETTAFDAPGRLSLPAIGGIRRYIKSERIDILHSHGYKTDIIGALAARGTACKLVSTPHGWSAQEGLLARIYETLDRVAFHFFDAVVPLSVELHEGLERYPLLRRRLRLIPNGVDLTEVDEAVHTDAQLQSWRDSGDRIIGYVGRLVAPKAVDTLLRGFARARLPATRLCLVGEGPEEVALRSLASRLGIADSVHFAGFRADRLALLRGFDVFVLPSRSEGTPRCVMESMAAGVPVVASDIPGCSALLEGGRCGLLFPVDDEAALAAAVTSVLGQPGLREQLVAAARERVTLQLSGQVMAGRYLALYRNLVANSAPGAAEHA